MDKLLSEKVVSAITGEDEVSKYTDNVKAELSKSDIGKELIKLLSCSEAYATAEYDGNYFLEGILEFIIETKGINFSFFSPKNVFLNHSWKNNE